MKKIQNTNTISSAELERYQGAVTILKNAWENLPEDIDCSEREIFIEMAAKVLKMYSKLSRTQKDKSSLN